LSNLRKRGCDAMAPRRKKRPNQSRLTLMSDEDWGPLRNTISGWFSDALGRDHPKPSSEACIKLARKIQIILNRHNNAELESIAELEDRPVDPFKLKDVWGAELEGKIIRRFMAAANNLMAEAEVVENFYGGYVWRDRLNNAELEGREDSHGVVTLADIQHLLGRIGAFPKARRTPPPAKRGHPKEAWHSVARDIAKEIISVLRESGYRGPLSDKYENSVTCVVCAKIINLAFGLQIDAAAFVSAVRNRDRTKRAAEKSFFEHYPDAAGIRILD